MNEVKDSKRIVSVKAIKNNNGARYSIELNGKEIHHMIDPSPPTATLRLTYYVTARPTLERKLVEIDEDAGTITQELQISLQLATE